jgi:hypothetical protein
MAEARRAENELMQLLTATRRDWRERDVYQVLKYLQGQGWPWARVLSLLPATAAEENSRPGDVVGAWRNPNDKSGVPPTDEYLAVKAELRGGGDPRAHPPG